jgi:prephenate dehydratase
MSKNIAYLGPPGTFTEEAANQYDAGAITHPMPSVSAVGASVIANDVDEGVVPIENSREGSVNDTLDLLIHGAGLAISNELVLPVVHSLVAKPGTDLNSVEIIYSHPNALGQCREFIEHELSQAKTAPSLSTVAAVEDMLASEKVAVAIARQRTTDLYNIEVLVSDILSDQINSTRFIVLSKKDHAPTGHDKTSICLAFNDDKPGLLHTVLGEFANHKINLTKVESRPSRESLGRYVFLIDLEGHHDVEPIKEVLYTVAGHASVFKLFGSYPRFSG